MEPFAEALTEDLQRYTAAARRQLYDQAKRRMHKQAEKGFLVGPPKLGYVVNRTREGSIAVLDPETAPLIARAFVEVAVNNLSLRQVTTLLQQEGLKGRRGEPISLSTVQRILRDPYYAHDNGSTAIVPAALFEAVQIRIEQRVT